MSRIARYSIARAEDDSLSGALRRLQDEVQEAISKGGVSISIWYEPVGREITFYAAAQAIVFEE